MAAKIIFGLLALIGVVALVRRLVLLNRDREHPPRVKATRRGHKAADSATETTPPPPASLRPVINENRCIGCNACMEACPEDGVFGVVDFETQVVNPSRCMGHGACASACPMDAITLALGSSARGVDLPQIKPNFASQIPGVYIVGELGGMGLIRNSMEQGRQAMESIQRQRAGGDDGILDVVIVGAGPAGLSASLAALGHKLRYVTLEQGDVGDTLRHAPRGSIGAQALVKLPVVGELDLAGKDKEGLIEIWGNIVRDNGLAIHFNERVETISRVENGFLVRSPSGEYQTRTVLLATGLGGTPQRLDVPGEDLPKVAYRLADPSRYRNRRVLVAGAGDTAIDAAIAIASAHPQTVTLANPNSDFSRCDESSRERLVEFELTGRVRVIQPAQIQLIAEKTVVIQGPAGTVELLNDDVIVCLGGIGPDALLKSLGLTVGTRPDTFWQDGWR